VGEEWRVLTQAVPGRGGTVSGIRRQSASGGPSAMRTHGDDVAEVLSMLGVRPLGSGRTDAFADSRLSLGWSSGARASTLRSASAAFSATLPQPRPLMDEAIEMVARLEEPDDRNFVAAHFRSEVEHRRLAGEEPEVAREPSAPPHLRKQAGESYGAGIYRCWTSGTGRRTPTSLRSMPPGVDMLHPYRVWPTPHRRRSSSASGRYPWPSRTRKTGSMTSSLATINLQFTVA